MNIYVNKHYSYFNIFVNLLWFAIYYSNCIQGWIMGVHKRFENTKAAIRSRKSKDRQYNGQKKQDK